MWRLTLVLAICCWIEPSVQKSLSILDLKSIIDKLGDEFLNHESLTPQVAANQDEVPHPQKVHNFARGLDVGQVSAVAVNPNDQPVIFHRGPTVWNQ